MQIIILDNSYSLMLLRTVPAYANKKDWEIQISLVILKILLVHLIHAKIDNKSEFYYFKFSIHAK